MRAFGAGLLLGGCLLACVHDARAAEPLVGKPAPVFARKSLDGGTLDLGALRGKVVLLDFWATWCAPCQVEMPRFIEWQRQYGPQGLQIVGISMDDDPELARKLAARMGINYPVAMGDEDLGTLYGGVLGLPLTFLIDREGVVRAVFRGEADLKAMEAQVAALAARPR